MVANRFFRFVLPVSVAALFAATHSLVNADEKSDEAAIRARMQDFVQAVAGRKANVVASFWTPKGEYVHDNGETIRGRDKLAKSYAAFFAGKQPKREVEVRNSSVRFLSKDTAVLTGALLVKHANPAKRSLHDFSVLLVRENGQWYFALLRESASESSLSEVDWLEGTWAGKTASGSIRLTFEWEPGKAFLRARYEITGKVRTLSGTQMIGRNPATGILQSWTFGSEGAISKSKWIQEKNRWILTSTSVLPDGSESSATNILTPIDQNSFTLQSTEQVVDGEKLEDTKPIKLTRVK